MNSVSMSIVIVCYNRVQSLNRLLNRLAICNYPRERAINLIVSIDKSDKSDVIDLAKNYKWEYGEKIVICRKERMGLKQHVLACGDLVNSLNLDAIIVFEDDVYPADDFFRFALEAVTYYRDDNRIAGISLFSHKYNYGSNYPFCPIENGSDTFFMQYAQSWGQVWMRDSWNDFRVWLDENDGKSIISDDFPSYIGKWSDNSWLKYHIKYCVENNKFFVYPYSSFTTCFADVGEHYKSSFGLKPPFTQVPLAAKKNSRFVFSSLDDTNPAIYDVFFENITLAEVIKKREKLLDNVCVDLYGEKKKENYRFILTTQPLPYKVLSSFSLCMKPHESNIIHQIEGKQVFLYDSCFPEQPPCSEKESRLARFVYEKSADGKIQLMVQYIKRYIMQCLFNRS